MNNKPNAGCIPDSWKQSHVITPPIAYGQNENMFLTFVETGFLGSSPSSLLGSQLAIIYTKNAAIAA